MRIYRCIKDVISGGSEVKILFTEGKIYEGYISATPLGEWAIQFRDDENIDHLALGSFLREHFEFIQQV